MIQRRRTRLFVSTRREKMMEILRASSGENDPQHFWVCFREVGRGYMETLTLVWFESLHFEEALGTYLSTV